MSKITIIKTGKPKKDCLPCLGAGEYFNDKRILIPCKCVRKTTHTMTEEEFVEKVDKAVYKIIKNIEQKSTEAEQMCCEVIDATLEIAKAVLQAVTEGKCC